MLFFLCILCIAIFCASILFVAAKYLRLKMRFQAFVCSILLMNMTSGICMRMIFFRKWNGIYDFMGFGLRQAVRMLPMTFLYNAVLSMVILLFLYFSNKGKDSITEIKSYKVVPVSSVQCFVALTGCLYISFAVADMCMPQFAYWSVDNQNMNHAFSGAVSLATAAHIKTNRHQTEYSYPLVNAELLNEIKVDDKVILVIGDSFIWGDGTSNVNNLWWRTLQRRIEDKGYGHCKVIAVGQCGASTQDQLRWLSQTDMLAKIDPDLIIIGYVTNDAQYVDEDGIVTPGQWAPESYLDNRLLKYVYRIFPNIAFKIDNALMSRDAAMTDLSEQDLYEYEEWEYQIIMGDNLDRYKAMAVEPLGELFRGLSVPYCLMTTPNTPDYNYFQVRYRNVLPLFEAAGIPVYDCLGDFSEKHGKDEEYFVGINPVNAHPGIAANTYHADYAMDMIEKNYPDVLGEKGGEKRGLEINDWMPFDRLNPSVEGNTVKFMYSDDWEKNCYLYMPMFVATVKICFASPLDVGGFAVKDADGNICEDFDIWVSYINEVGYEELAKKKLRVNEGVYLCDYGDVTSLNIHRSSQGQGEQEYKIEIVEK